MTETFEPGSERYEKRKQDYFSILGDIIRIDSPSGKEMALSEHICSCYSNGRWQSERDEMGNVYFTPADHTWEERLPLLNAHIDTYAVRMDRHQTTQEQQAEILGNPDFLTLQDGEIVKSPENIQAGFDDKAGVALILYLMHHTDLCFRAIFTVQEEKAVSGSQPYGRGGGAGIEGALKKYPEFFRSAPWAIMIDRMNGSDIIHEYGDDDDGEGRDRPRISLCSNNFVDHLEKISTEANHPMKRAQGRIGDAYNIRRAFPNLDVVNLSCGYYDDHYPEESLKIDETLSIMSVVEKCILEM